MHATIRRYESVDQSRTKELVKKADDSLLPALSDFPGFKAYSLIDAGNGVVTSVTYFDTVEHADATRRVASTWLREQELETALPTAPMITSGKVLSHKTRELVEA